MKTGVILTLRGERKEIPHSNDVEEKRDGQAEVLEFAYLLVFLALKVKTDQSTTAC